MRTHLKKWEIGSIVKFMKAIGLSNCAGSRSAKWRRRIANFIVLVALVPCLAEKQVWHQAWKWSDSRLDEIGADLEILGAAMILVSLCGIMYEWREKRMPVLSAWRYGIALALGVLGGVVIPCEEKPGGMLTANQSACINNLRLIDSAKQQWAHDFGKSDRDTPQASDLWPYLARGIPPELPYCPADDSSSFSNSYNINSVGEAPTCKIAPSKHILP